MNHTDNRYSFFVIEDSRGDYALVKEYLQEQFSLPAIVHAQTFKEARTIFESGSVTNFSCILLDLSLPDKSGKDLINSVLELASGIPVLVLTGYTDMSLSAEFLEQGISDYLLKDELSPSLLYKSIIYSIKRNEYQRELQASETKYRTLFELSPEPMWLVDSITQDILDVNKAAISHYGYSRSEFLELRRDDIERPDDNSQNLELVTGSVQHEVVVEKDTFLKHRKKNGDIIQVSIESSKIEYQGRTADLVLIKDITEKLQNEKRRRLLESVVKNTSESVVILDVSLASTHPRIVYVNDGFCEMTGYSEDDINNRSLSFLSGELTDSSSMKALEEAIDNREHAEVELIHYQKDGEPFWTQIALVPVKDDAGSATHMVAIGRNISARKESEEKLQTSLSEKNLLLAEIHHRVKNNLALVSGMLQMQVFDEENEEVINKLNNSMLRVETMASIHQLLYESSSFSKLEFSKIINKLIKATHDSFSSDKEIDIEIDTVPFELNINKAVPCSLIINEAITNVYKHAFQNRKRGWIKATLRRDDDLVTFRLEDDGQGLPDDFDIDNLSSLGTKIITALVKQLRGNFSLKSRDGSGSIFSLSFSAIDESDAD